MTLDRFHHLRKRLLEPNSFLTWSSPSTALTALLLPRSAQFQRQAHQKNKHISKYKQIKPRGQGFVKVIILYLFKPENLPLFVIYGCLVSKVQTAGSTTCKNDFYPQLASVSPRAESQSKIRANIQTLAKVRAPGRWRMEVIIHRSLLNIV